MLFLHSYINALLHILKTKILQNISCTSEIELKANLLSTCMIFMSYIQLLSQLL